jgi:hypothetical protein
MCPQPLGEGAVPAAEGLNFRCHCLPHRVLDANVEQCQALPMTPDKLVIVAIGDRASIGISVSVRPPRRCSRIACNGEDGTVRGRHLPHLVHDWFHPVHISVCLAGSMWPKLGSTGGATRPNWLAGSSVTDSAWSRQDVSGTGESAANIIGRTCLDGRLELHRICQETEGGLQKV